jgi:hypothetical protein
MRPTIRLMQGVVYIAPLDEVPADGSMVDPVLARFGAKSGAKESSGAHFACAPLLPVPISAVT